MKRVIQISALSALVVLANLISVPVLARSNGCGGCWYPSHGYMTPSSAPYNSNYYASNYISIPGPTYSATARSAYDPQAAYRMYLMAQQNYQRQLASADYYVLGGAVYK